MTVEDDGNRPPRRHFFGRIAGAAAIGLAGWTAPSQADEADWPGPLKGRYRQVVDAYQINQGAPLEYAATFMATNTPAGSATSVLILRHTALVLALNDAMWAKYRIGESFHVFDPGTDDLAVKNPFYQPRPEVLHKGAALDELLAAGTVIGACGVALHSQSFALADKAGVEKSAAEAEWTANLIPGITLLPSGVWGLNRAQLAGCSYCTGG